MEQKNKEFLIMEMKVPKEEHLKWLRE